jgi:hypothetical protein
VFGLLERCLYCSRPFRCDIARAVSRDGRGLAKERPVGKAACGLARHKKDSVGLDAVRDSVCDSPGPPAGVHRSSRELNSPSRRLLSYSAR